MTSDGSAEGTPAASIDGGGARAEHRRRERAERARVQRESARARVERARAESARRVHDERLRRREHAGSIERRQ
jgi:hypothetical protein